MRRCIGCGALIARGSRCAACQRQENAKHNAGRSNEARGRWARRVKLRDGFACRRCGSTERVEAHHVTPLAAGGANTLANGLTLCHACHAAEHRGRDRRMG